MPEHLFVFDLGKVLLDFDYDIAVRRISAETSIPPETLRRFLGATPLLLAYEEGLMSTREFFSRFQAGTGYPGEMERFRLLFSDIFTPLVPMIDLHERCRMAGHDTYIFSNTNELAIGHIRAQFPFFAAFTGYILSYECRSMKPAPGMYDTLEALSGVRGGRMVYFDDRPENVETALQRGWNATVHDTPGDSIAFAEKFLGR